ncbi:hypothetical protein [Cupriavidus numazuensis]|uniref:hypothetical protein n=1 Tax=Cupriavidus numazuensis TaxID=221992 RepID=UPI001BA85044|nr:hypothetical protein [Cupriavidus numazuensis]
MDSRFTEAEGVFRQEVRDFVTEALRADIHDQVPGHQRLNKDDYVRWQRLLHACCSATATTTLGQYTAAVVRRSS